jgi:tRNA pseudouridine55 synthase
MVKIEIKTEVIKLYKKLGETPLECIERFRLEKPEYAKTNMTYLGRLDPMAEGLLLVLAGNTRDKKQFLDMDKTYEFEVLWGFETDTYDTLGLVTGTGPMPQKLDLKMGKLIENIQKKKTQSYPPYSSRTVGGKALHTWAREGKIDEIDIPTRQVRIFSLEHTNTKLLNKEELLKEIESRIDLVKGDFRQAEIIKTWRRAVELQAELNHTHEYLISGFRADVSSGTYIRSLAKEMGEMLDTSACAFSIKRIRVGEYKL